MTHPPLSDRPTRRASSAARLASALALGLLAFVAASVLPGCTTEVDPADMDLAKTARVRAYFNYTGTRQANGVDAEVDDMTIQMIDRARVSIDFAIMGFTRPELIDALERAWLRGVDLRFVGDGRHMEHHTRGYELMDKYNIPMMVGNMFHIMHNKFFIVDDRFVITGTGNITPTGYDRNNNNYVFIDSPVVAQDFKAEFEQMFEGRFGFAKRRLADGNNYMVGDTRVEVFFSPQEDAMGRILESMEQATHSIHFMIFAFTKDQIGSLLVSKHQEFTHYNQCCDPDLQFERDADPDLVASCQPIACETPFLRKEVRGVIDKSQLHSNGPYHEVYRLISFGVPFLLDGNDNSRQPGDYQAGGGRLHSKTMIIDGETDHGHVVTGSFNWSSSATTANDETLLVLHNGFVVEQHAEFFDDLWDNAKPIGIDFSGPEGTVQPGDVVFNEIHWDGWNGLDDPSDFGGDQVANDEFIELLNTTNRPIDLSMWTIATRDDFSVGLYPGTIIGPGERFLILDQNLEPFQDLDPQDSPHAFGSPDFVMNGANDPRFLRMNLRNANFYLRLVDPRGNTIDEAGDGGPPFVGGRRTEGTDDEGDPIIRNYSMERVHVDCGGAPDCDIILPGTDPAAWRICALPEGGTNVNPPFKDKIIASPGEINSINTGTTPWGEPDPSWRNPE